MPWCTKCNAQYRDGFTNCSVCGSKLCDTGVGKNEGDEKEQGVYEMLVVNAGDAVELAYITSMLESESIPYRIAEADIGQYLRILHGASFFGRGIFVDRRYSEKAAAIATSYRAVAEPYDELAEECPARKEWGYRLFALAYLVLALLIGAL